jgi:hypothetical protein
VQNIFTCHVSGDVIQMEPAFFPTSCSSQKPALSDAQCFQVMALSRARRVRKRLAKNKRNPGSFDDGDVQL